MQGDSLWLGGFRNIAKLLMYVSAASAVILIGWLIISRNLLGGDIGMYEAVRPQGRPIVAAMLISIVAALVFTSIYLSDEFGRIEHKHLGWFDVVSLVCSRIAMISIGLVVLVMFYEVVARYVFAAGTIWANEMSKWIAGFVYLFAGLYAMQQRSHIRIFVLYDIMPRWMQRTANVLSVTFIITFAFCLVWGAYNEAEAKFLRFETYGTAWDPPIPATIKPAIIIIIIMVAIQALSNLIADWNRAEEHAAIDEVDETEIEDIRRAIEEEKQ